MIACFASCSGAHFNPAVTLGLLAARRFESKLVLPYILSQLAGGLAAAIVAKILFGVVSGTHIPSDPSNPFLNVGTEVMISAILMLVILRAESSKAAMAIGLSVVFLQLLGQPITGGSMNPARSFGPDLLANGAATPTLWIYFVGPILGMLLAVGANAVLEQKQALPVRS